MDDYFSIQEVANLLSVTTQAIYKRLQQDSDTLDEFVSNKGGRKSLSKEGVIKLADLMGIEEPFKEEKEKEEAKQQQIEAVTNAQEELLQYLRDDNARLQKELDDVKKELAETRELRENDHRSAEEERRKHEEARMRSDTLLMRAIMNQQPPSLLDRIFHRKKKEPQIDNSEQ